jgi:hypothetical protein
MSHPMAIAGILALVVMGLVFLVLQGVGRRRKGYSWQPDLSYRVHELSAIEENTSALLLTPKSAEERFEERRDYLKERAKNDRYQDLD